MAKRTFTLTAKETEILIYTLLGEAEGEGADGMRAVASVIVNRSLTEKNSGDFPDDPIAVVSETRPGGGFQFDGGPGTSRYEEMKAKYGPGDPLYAQAARVVASHIAAPNPPDATGMGAVYFDTNGTTQKAWAGGTTKKIGGHFYYETKGLKPKGDVASTPASAMIDAASNAALAGIDAAFPAVGSTKISAPKTALDAAQAWLGKDERNADDVKALSEFFKSSGGIVLDPSNTAWCAAFLNGVLGSAGMEGTGKATARSFLNIGETVDAPKVGDVVVFERGPKGGWQGHVGIITAINADGTLSVLGGNQSDGLSGDRGVSVNVSTYGTDKVLGYRRITPETVGTVAAADIPGAGALSYADPANASRELLAATGATVPPGAPVPAAMSPALRARRSDSLAQQASDTRAEAIAEAREGARREIARQLTPAVPLTDTRAEAIAEAREGARREIVRQLMPQEIDASGAPTSGFETNIWGSGIGSLFDDTGQPSSVPAPKLTRADIIDPLGRPSSGQELTGVARTQASLKAAGFDPGPVDGKMGPQTKAAIRAFQKASGLKVDGIVGPKTSAGLDAIGGASPAIRDPLGVGAGGMSATPTLNADGEPQATTFRDNVGGRPAYDPSTGLFMGPGVDANVAFDPRTGLVMPVGGRERVRADAFTAIDMATAMQVVLAPVAGVRVPQGPTMDPIGAGASFRGVEAMKRSVSGMTAAQLQAIVASIPANAPPVPLPGKIDNSANASSYPPFVGSGQTAAGGGVAYPPSKLTNDAAQPAAPAPKKVIPTTPGAYGPQFAVIDVNGKPIKDGTKVQIGSTVKTRSGDRVAVLNIRTGLAMLVNPNKVEEELRTQKRDAIFDYAKNNLGLDDTAAKVMSEIDEQTTFGRLAREGGDVLGIRVPGARDMIGKEIASGSAAIKMGITSLIGSGFAFARSVVPAAAKAAVGAVVGSAGKIPLPSMATVKPGAVSKPAQQRATVIRQRTEDVSLPPAAAPKPPATQPVTQPAAGPSWGSVPPVYGIKPAVYKTVAVPPKGMVAQGQYNLTPAEKAAFGGSMPLPKPAVAAPVTKTEQVLVSPKEKVLVTPGKRVQLAPGISGPERRAAPPPTVQIKTGKKVAVGTTYQQGKSGSGKPYTYRVEADGSIKNLTTGRTTSSPTTKTTTSTAGLKPGDRVYNADTNEWNIKR